jgi:hypothetical protein
VENIGFERRGRIWENVGEGATMTRLHADLLLTSMLAPIRIYEERGKSEGDEES